MHLLRRQQVFLRSLLSRTFRDMEEAYFENNRVDALAMERLTASPYVMDIHGFCGMTVVTGFAGTDISKVARFLNSTERLRLGLQAAKGVADVHSIGVYGGQGNNAGSKVSLVHNDLNLANVVVTLDHRPVLNDFNVAILLMKHNVTGETCQFSSRFPNPQWKSPEEQVLEEDDDPDTPPMVSEKIDIYALGNVFYRLAAGKSPWKAKNAVRLTPEEKATVARRKRIEGQHHPPFPEGMDVEDPATRVLLQAMEMCYRYQPQERPTAHEVVHFLEEQLALLDKAK